LADLSAFSLADLSAFSLAALSAFANLARACTDLSAAAYDFRMASAAAAVLVFFGAIACVTEFTLFCSTETPLANGRWQIT
jgi:hypothetical protein